MACGGLGICLNHKLPDDSMEATALEAKAHFASTERSVHCSLVSMAKMKYRNLPFYANAEQMAPEVLCSPWHIIRCKKDERRQPLTDDC